IAVAPVIYSAPLRVALPIAEYGDPDGAPVLFMPGAASGRRMSFGGTLPHRRRIRLISIHRPGLGASTPDPEKTLRSVGADLTRLDRKSTRLNSSHVKIYYAV